MVSTVIGNTFFPDGAGYSMIGQKQLEVAPGFLLLGATRLASWFMGGR